MDAEQLSILAEPVIKWASEEEKREHFDAEINREWESWLKVQEVTE